jgi:hypothetical protein
MTKRLIMILALAFVVGIAFSAYAEVQNVKVSGDLLLRAITRSQFNLVNEFDGDNTKYKAAGLTSQMRLRVDADLTDNVSTTIRLINERAWGSGLSLYEPGAFFMEDGIRITDGQYLQGAVSIWDSPIEVDLAYVTLKEFLYSPLTLTLGRQELRFGNALIIGDSDTNMYANAYGIPFDLSLKKSFDAMRATLDYTPWVLDIVYAKLNENDVWWLQNLVNYEPEKNDADLYGMNASWDMKALGITGKTDFYFWRKENKLLWAETAGSANKDVVNTVGALVSGQLMDRLTGSLEMAWQFGRAPVDLTGLNDSNSKRRAMAIQAILNYAFDKKGSPTLGLCYTYLSGDNKDDNKNKFWDPMFEDQTPNNIVNAILPNSGVSAINLLGSIKPKEDLVLAMNFGYYMLPAKPKDSFYVPSPYGADDFTFHDVGESHSGKTRILGSALDLTATYDYTEDVQLGLTWGMFQPGKAFDREEGFKKTATQLIGSMKVTF